MSGSFKTPIVRQVWPVEIRLKSQEKLLEIDFDDGSKFRYPAELLRVESPSAEVQGHGAGQKTIVAGRRHVGIMGVEPVGNYAIRINWSDGHNAGIYSYEHFRQICQCDECKKQTRST